MEDGLGEEEIEEEVALKTTITKEESIINLPGILMIMMKMKSHTLKIESSEEEDTRGEDLSIEAEVDLNLEEKEIMNSEEDLEEDVVDLKIEEIENSEEDVVDLKIEEIENSEEDIEVDVVDLKIEEASEVEDLEEDSKTLKADS
jgi:hypothetical protein